MSAALKKLSAALAPHAVAVLAAAGVLSFIIYLRFIVQPANLLLLYTRPLADLARILDLNRLAAFQLMAFFLIETLLYGIAYWAALHTHKRDAWVLVFLWTALFGAALCLQYPYGAADIFDNIMHGRILGVYGQNPFVQLIKAYPNDPFFEYAYWKTAPSAYGPLWELLAGLTARLAGNGILANIIAFKLMPGLFLFASMAVTAVLLKEQAPERALAAVVLLGWNPMMLFETFGNGHNDIVMIFWVPVAIWAISKRRYTLSILALLMGALFKYMPLLFIPAAGLVALRELPDLKARLRFIIVTGLLCLGLIYAAYAPFWDGWQTLTISRRTMMYTASIPSLFYFSYSSLLGAARTGQLISGVSAALTALFALYQAWRAWKNPGWLGFAYASFYSIMFYLLVACPWFQVWYAIWPLTIAVLFPPNAELGLALVLSVSVLLKPFVIRPIFFWRGTPPSRLWRETRLLIGILGIPWLYTLWMLARAGWRARLAAKQNGPTPAVD